MGDVNSFFAGCSDFETFKVKFATLNEHDQGRVRLEVRAKYIGFQGDATKVISYGPELVDFLGIAPSSRPGTPLGQLPTASVLVGPSQDSSSTPGTTPSSVNTPIVTPTTALAPLSTDTPAPPLLPLGTALPPAAPSTAASYSSALAASASSTVQSVVSTSAGSLPLQAALPSAIPLPPLTGFSTAAQLGQQGSAGSFVTTSSLSSTMSPSSTSLPTVVEHGSASGFGGLNVPISSGASLGFHSNPVFQYSSSFSSPPLSLQNTANLANTYQPNVSAPALLSDDKLDELWNDIDNFDVSTMDADSFRVFEYQGFNPNMILTALHRSATDKKIPEETFKYDITYMCAIAAIKGSVNSHNINRMSPEAAQRITELELKYNLKRGGGKGEPPHVVTFSRVAAAFPGKIMQLISQGKIPAREFIGPLRSNTLPAVMRHQAFAAIIPRSLKEKVREFLLMLVTAFSVDQSYCIRPEKKDKFEVETIFETQRNFIQISANARYPKEETRKKAFKQLNLEFDDMLDCARALQAKMSDFRIITRDDLIQAVNNLG